MMRCVRGETNLKSTAYNQNGQNYFEQLRAYNSMSSHLRRVLLAKCVVDAKNKSYTNRKKQTCKQIDCKPRRIRVTNDVIDRLAYDTLHHPTDILRMTCDSNYVCQQEDYNDFPDCYNYDMTCSQSRTRKYATCPNSPTCKPNARQTKEKSFAPFSHKKKLNSEERKSSRKFHEILYHGYEEDSTYETASDFPTREDNQAPTADSSSRSYENSESASQTNTKSDEAKYAKFVYEITRDIMHNGLYTDDEMREVFKNHIENNKESLNMNKMLYEIYRLKLSLNISDDSDDEELEDLFNNQQLWVSPKIRPPTPPKVLDDSKVIEKITPYQEINEIRRASTGNKSVTLVQPNPELLVTERDILSSLVESNIKPQEAHQIYRKLSNKSKYSDFIDMGRLKIKQSNATNETAEVDNDNLKEPSNLHDIPELEKFSITQDVVTLEDKNVQA